MTLAEKRLLTIYILIGIGVGITLVTHVWSGNRDTAAEVVIKVVKIGDRYFEEETLTAYLRTLDGPQPKEELLREIREKAA